MSLLYTVRSIRTSLFPETRERSNIRAGNLFVDLAVKQGLLLAKC
jgi:hypothetical protein